MMKQELSFEEFIQQLQLVNDGEAESVQGKHYSQIRIDNGKIHGLRDDTGNPFEIDIKKLYQAYDENERINTSILKPYVDRAQSPAYAILMKMGLAD